MAHMRNALKRLHLDIFPFLKETMFLKAFVLQRITCLTDYGHTIPNSLRPKFKSQSQIDIWYLFRIWLNS